MAGQVDILLVDDEARNLDALEVILTDPGYRLLRADNADRALHLLLQVDVAAIVLDIKMPGVSGLELAHIIKSTKRFQRTPIVLLTAHLEDEQQVIAGYGAGAVDYLVKPVNPQILRHKVAVFADLHRKTRELAELNGKLEERVRERTLELQRSEDALRAAAAQKDEFLAVLAHELRNPLAPLRTGLDILLRDGDRNGPTLAVMDRQLDHMVRLIDDLLDISRLSRGAMELKCERLDLSAAVLDAIENCRALFDRRRQRLSHAVAPGVDAYADPTRISQILSNLLNNAAKFTPEGGSIRVELEDSGDPIAVRVADSGIGVPGEQLERIFQMFTRLERPGVRTQPGLGIGLALARRLAEMHGGTLSASSAGVAQGTTFTLSLPRPSSTDQRARPAIAPVSSTEAGPVPRLKIVLVEDNHDVLETMSKWLRSLGHDVWGTEAGRTAVQLAGEVRPDMVLCDLGLPGMDGIEVCRQIRSLPPPGQRSAPVMVALTGWGREEDRAKTKQAGFDHHLVKPVKAEQLQKVIAAVVATPP